MTQIDTPALLIDLDLMERNISTMADFFRNKTAKLRAHSKVHRVPIIAHKQIEAGAKGLCCQKVAEAEVMVAAGIKDIIVTNEIVAPSKIKRLLALTRQRKNLRTNRQPLQCGIVVERGAKGGR